MPSNHLILCHPLLLPPSIFPSIRVFSNESTLRMRWPKDWSFSFNINPSNEHPGLISFRMAWLDLLALHGTLKSLLQLHSSKASILCCSAFFTVQLSHPYMTPGKTISLTRRTFVGKAKTETYAKPRGEDQNSTACVLQSPVSLSIPHSYVKGRKRKRVFTPHSVIGFVNSEIPHRNRSSSSALNLAPLSPHVSAAWAAAQLCFLTSRLSSPSPQALQQNFHFSRSEFFPQSSARISPSLQSVDVQLCCAVLSSSVVPDSLRPQWTCSPPGSSVHAILQARKLERVAFPSPGNLPTSGIEARSPALQVDSLQTELPGKPQRFN